MTTNLLARLRFLTWPIVVLSIAVGVSIGTILGIMSIPRNPLVVKDVHEADGLAVRGGYIDLSFTVTRTRECPARIERWLWQWTGEGERRIKRWVQVDASGANPPINLGNMQTYMLAVPIPGGVTAGKWHYWSRTRETCVWTSWLYGENIRDSGDIPVEILEPTAQSPAQVITQSAPVLILPGATAP